MDKTSLVNSIVDQLILYFPGMDLPIVYFYSDDSRYRTLCKKAKSHCIFTQIRKVRIGKSIALDKNTINCEGGRHYLGFADETEQSYAESVEPNFMELFLSNGIPGIIDGERFKKTPAHSRSYYREKEIFESPAKYLVMKRLDLLEPGEIPNVAVFITTPDFISGLYNLANYDWNGSDAVLAPWGSGCCSVFLDPFLQALKPADQQQCIIGLFDSAARPFIGSNELSFAIPWKRLLVMMNNAQDSFLRNKNWHSLMNRKQIS